jgi:MFS family permease
LSSTNKEKIGHNDWAGIALASLTMAITVGLPTTCMPVLFKEIAGDLNLNVVELGEVWGAVSLGSIFVLPFGGYICDRLGAKRTLIGIGLLSGITGALRGVSTGLISLLVTTILWGLISAAIMPAISMAGSQSAGKLKQASTQGWISVGGGLGFMSGSLISATWISPWLGGWRNVLFAYGLLAILITLLWFFRSDTPGFSKSAIGPSSLPFKQIFVSSFRNKNLLFIGIALLMYQGCVMGMQGYLPFSLQENGWSTAAASGTVAAYNAMGTIGVVPLTMLSDRIGSRKICLLVSFLVAIVGIGVLAIVHDWRLWIPIILVGVFSQMNSALFATMGIEAGRKESTSSGTALGFVLGYGLIGRTFAPPVGNSLSGLNASFGWPFIFWSFLAVIGTLVLLFIKENIKGKLKPNNV